MHKGQKGDLPNTHRAWGPHNQRQRQRNILLQTEGGSAKILNLGAEHVWESKAKAVLALFLPWSWYHAWHLVLPEQGFKAYASYSSYLESWCVWKTRPPIINLMKSVIGYLGLRQDSKPMRPAPLARPDEVLCQSHSALPIDAFSQGIFWLSCGHGGLCDTHRASLIGLTLLHCCMHTQSLFAISLLPRQLSLPSQATACHKSDARVRFFYEEKKFVFYDKNKNSLGGFTIYEFIEFILSDVKALSIFNRYGTKVYTYGQNYTNQWHGQSESGSELPDGTYYYVITRNSGNSITGWIYINR